ncbi:hypothetical protein ID866_2201 [Astraeus odoratus]|nr:hypothetical protein ID866_2201 [Astraeus odoratus]
MPEQNIHHFLLDREDQKSWSDFIFQVDVISGQQRLFREFLERVRDGATALGTDPEHGGLGIRRENDELVGILSENCLDYVALIHSLLAITVPFATMSSYSTSFEFQHAIKLSGATRLFVSPSLLHLARSSGLPEDHVYILEGHVDGYASYADLVDQRRVWNGPEGMQVMFNVLPIHHSYGLNVTTFRCFSEPLTMLFLSKWDADMFLDALPKYRVTSLALVPSLIHQIVHHPRFMTADFSTVQTINSGAAHLPLQLAQRLRSQFPCVERIGGGYGMSECALTVSLHPLPGMLDGRAKVVPGSVGMLIPGMEARIVREDGTLAAVNEVGELHVKGGCVSPGYWKDETSTNAAFVDGWLRTGDRMRIDADGVLYFEDRAKDTLKVSGMQVSPLEIENTIRDHPDNLVDDVTVAGVSGGRTADERVPRAWIVLSPAGMELGASESKKRILAWVRGRLSRYKWLRGGIAVIDQIPKSSTGKVLRRQLVDQYEAERTEPMARL